MYNVCDYAHVAALFYNIGGDTQTHGAGLLYNIGSDAHGAVLLYNICGDAHGAALFYYTGCPIKKFTTFQMFFGFFGQNLG